MTIAPHFFDGLEDTGIVKTFVFTSTIHNGAACADDTTWEYHGTEAGAKKEFQDILNRSWSPFVTFRYEEKLQDGNLDWM